MVQGSGIHHGLRGFVGTEHYEQIRHHGRLALFVQFDDMTYTASATMNKGRKTTVTVPLSKFQTRERLYDLGFILNEILGGEEVKFVVDNIRFELK